MGDPSEIDTVSMMEEKSLEQQWTQQKEVDVANVEELLFENSHSEEYASTRIVKRKAKKKDEGPLEIFCGMIVEHQIGMTGLHSVK